jgi:hypothetical protein
MLLLIAAGVLAWVGVAFGMVVLVTRGVRDLYIAQCERKLARNWQARNLLMPYISWSDTVAHNAMRRLVSATPSDRRPQTLAHSCGRRRGGLAGMCKNLQ